MPTKKELEARIVELEAEVSTLKTEKHIIETAMTNQVEEISDVKHHIEELAKDSNIYRRITQLIECPNPATAIHDSFKSLKWPYIGCCINL